MLEVPVQVDKPGPNVRKTVETFRLDGIVPIGCLERAALPESAMKIKILVMRIVKKQKERMSANWDHAMIWVQNIRVFQKNIVKRFVLKTYMDAQLTENAFPERDLI